MHLNIAFLLLAKLMKLLTIQLHENFQKIKVTSTSGDSRVASVVLVKNDGNMYLRDLKESINLPITSHMLSHCNKLDEINVTKSIKSRYTTSK